MAIIMHKVKDNDAGKEEDSVSIGKVSETYFKLWNIHEFYPYMLYVLLESINLI